MRESGERPWGAVWLAVLASVAVTACSRTELDLGSEPSVGVPGTGTGVDTSAGAADAAGAHEAGGGSGSGGSEGGSSGSDGNGAGSEGGATGPGATLASTYLINPAHTAMVAPVKLTAPLMRAWTKSLGAPVSFPLVVGATVYVTTNGESPETSGSDAHVFALDASTGSTIWSADLPGASFANIAYDDGRIFAMEGENDAQGAALHAYDAATGALTWTAARPLNEFFFDAPPVAYQGIVYTYGEGDGGTVYAYDEATGTLLWQQLTEDGGEGSPAVSEAGVFVAEGCQQVYAFDRVSGAPLWRHEGPCSGGGGETPLLDGDTLFVRDSLDGNLALDTTTGAPTAIAFASDVPPALDGAQLFTVTGGTLAASDAVKGTTSWTFAGDGRLATSPLVAGETVYVGSSEGNLYAVREDTGALVWSENTGLPLQTTEEFVSPPRVVFAAGGGLLFVPVGASLFAYGPAAVSPGDGGTGLPDAADGEAGCTWSMAPFTPAQTGESPIGLGIGDLDHDGHPDLAIADSYIDELGEHLGHGDGTFAPESTYPTPLGSGSGPVIDGDVDGDGNLDVVVADPYSGYKGPYVVSVFLGRGDGTLKPRIDSDTASEPRDLGLADFNRDGHLDLAVVAGSGVDVLLGKGDGTFEPAVAYTISTGAAAVASGDWNGDGATDLAVTDEDGDDVAVLLGKGDGTFGAPVPYAVGTLPEGIAAGDVDGDGHLDLTVANDEDDTVSVLLGVGDGTFHPQAVVACGEAPGGVAIADLNRDGRQDLVVSNGLASTVSILLGNGHGTFQPQFVYGTGAAPGAVAVTDLNGDGWPDLAVVDGNDDTVTVFLGACR
jgi:outer membrane protein assembly factor BamB